MIVAIYRQGRTVCTHCTVWYHEHYMKLYNSQLYHAAISGMGVEYAILFYSGGHLRTFHTTVGCLYSCACPLLHDQLQI